MQKNNTTGFPSPATDYLEHELNLHHLVVKKPAATFFMKAANDSMLGAGIFSGDILVIDRSLTASAGHIVVANLDGELIVRRLCYKQGHPYLMAENKNYPPLAIRPENDFQIFGVLTYHLHKHQLYPVNHSCENQSPLRSSF